MGHPFCKKSLIAFIILTLTACGGSGDGKPHGNPGADGSNNSGQQFATAEEYFDAEVSPQLDFCRSCHTPEGVAGSDPEAERFMLSANAAEDFANTHASWEALGKGVEQNMILVEPSDSSEPHSGGKPWPAGSAPYEAMKTILQCWDNPSNCTGLIGSGGNGEQLPLLGDLQANGGRNYAAVHCEGMPDDEPLPMDPRELIAGDNLNNADYAVWYNDPFEICETEALFENQRRQNELLGFAPDDPDRIYTAKPRPQTCGEWRTAVENGRQYIFQNPITGAFLTRQGFYNWFEYLGYPIEGDPKEVSEMLATLTHQRYGWPKHPYRNPFPMPGEDPNATDGGSLQLPIGLNQVKENGKWTGEIGASCFTCHIGQIGTGEVLGNSAKRDGHPEIYGGSEQGTFVSLNGSNIDTGIVVYDIDRANNGPLGPDSMGIVFNTPGYMAARTRGTNAADQEIANVMLGRDLDTLDWRAPIFRADMLGKLVPSAPFIGGDQDMPTWWWTHNKSRYLWIGFGSAGSSRGNFFPSSTNNENGHWSKRREGDYQDLDMWLNAIEAPAWPYGYCSNADGSPAQEDDPNCINRPLAEQGAILFHSKDLWAEGGNSDIPAPPVGNGSCASCHGGYSPRYTSQPGFLPDPRLAGMSGTTVPLSIVGTDPAQTDLFPAGTALTEGLPGASSEPLLSGIELASTWFSYADANPDYILPEEKPPFVEAIDDFTGAPGTCGLRTLGGYTAQPLHGVWATAPFFHNGSVPDVWGVLKPQDRPAVWLRQQVPASEAGPNGDRGFDTRMTRAFDHEKLGWNYQVLGCGDRLDAATVVSCYPNENGLSFTDIMMEPLRVLADYFSPPYVIAPGEDEVTKRSVYNTHAYSKGNEGHAFTKVLTDEERFALIEYLKTL